MSPSATPPSAAPDPGPCAAACTGSSRLLSGLADYPGLRIQRVQRRCHPVGQGRPRPERASRLAPAGSLPPLAVRSVPNSSDGTPPHSDARLAPGATGLKRDACAECSRRPERKGPDHQAAVTVQDTICGSIRTLAASMAVTGGSVWSDGAEAVSAKVRLAGTCRSLSPPVRSGRPDMTKGGGKGHGLTLWRRAQLFYAPGTPWVPAARGATRSPWP